MAGRQKPGKVDFGSARINVGRDFVMGDKVEHHQHTTTNNYGAALADEAGRKQFQASLDEMRDALRAIQAAVTASATLTADEKDETAAAISAQAMALKQVKETVAALPPAQPPAPDLGTKIEASLTKASGIMDTLQKLGAKAGDLGGKVAEFTVKYGPLVAAAKKLVGL
jgi:hypothetical protein